MECKVSGVNRGRQAGSRYGFVSNAANLELNVPLNGQPM